MKKSNIYTRRGDCGETSLVYGTRVCKASCKLESYGTIDELNSQLGLLLTYVTEGNDAEQLLRIQSNLFSIGALLATEADRITDPFPSTEIVQLEQAIDCAHSELPPWRGFTLPGGCRAAAVAHVCRTVCRRAERILFALNGEEPVDANLLTYINRLSDYLYILACRLNNLQGVEENLWHK